MSAYGLQEATRSFETGEQVLRLYQEVETSIAQRFANLESEVKERISNDFQNRKLPLLNVSKEVGLRLKGQDSEIFLPYEEGSNLAHQFEASFRALFGFYPGGRSIEVSRLRLKISNVEAENSKELFQSAPVEEDHGEKVRVIFDPFSTLYIEPGWKLKNGNQGSRLLEFQGDPFSDQAKESNKAVENEILTQRFRAVVDEMGEQLRRTALSVNIKERLDFSCALLDASGRLVVNAPHIPVHLGALGVCVREVVKALPMEPGDVIIMNHPGYGGSHLPDVTLIAPLFSLTDDATAMAASPERIGFLANRAHHAEIGGLRPGSMPPTARSLGEEGVVIPPMYLFRKGEPRWEEIRHHLSSHRYPSRQVEENLADLQAQVASIRRGNERFMQLQKTWGSRRLTQHMTALREMAYRFVWPKLQSVFNQPRKSVLHLDDGTQLAVQIRKTSDRLVIDFKGTSDVHPGNTNANPAIVSSVVLYVFRVLVGQGRDLPLNEGFLENVDLRIPRSCLNPDFPDDPFLAPAVVGGNVEVSQRLTDLLFQAMDLAANSQGTMNNLLFGNRLFSFYETLGGGAGAGPGFNGASGMHVHMSNTAVTDPEILEHRFPVRLERFQLRPGSGGAGRFVGGDGLIREFCFLEGLTLSILAQMRTQAPVGGGGGNPGMPGKQVFIRNSESYSLSGDAELEVEPGDRLIIETPGGGGWGGVAS